MSHIFIADDFFHHPSVVGLSQSVPAMFIAGVCYSSRYDTDAHLVAGAVRILAAEAGVEDKDAGVAELVAAGLWTRDPGGFHIEARGVLWKPGGADITPARQQWNALRRSVAPVIYERDGRVCVKCGASDALTIDHVVPIVAGGSHEHYNLQVLCRSCNSRKGSR